jgi:cell division protein FtsL
MATPTQSRLKSRARVRSARIRPWLVILVLVLGEMLLVTWCRVQHIKVGYQITQATEEKQQLIKNQTRLKVEIARLRSPERIAKIARNQLGLLPPTEEQTKVLP